MKPTGDGYVDGVAAVSVFRFTPVYATGRPFDRLHDAGRGSLGAPARPTLGQLQTRNTRYDK